MKPHYYTEPIGHDYFRIYLYTNGIGSSVFIGKEDECKEYIKKHPLSKEDMRDNKLNDILDDNK